MLEIKIVQCNQQTFMLLNEKERRVRRKIHESKKKVSRTGNAAGNGEFTPKSIAKQSSLAAV